jgi:anti-anti-sigma factor
MVKITVEPAPSIPTLKIITIRGSIDSVTHKQFDKKIFSVIEQDESNFIFDLSNVHYLSSIGMMCLINYLKFMNDTKRLCKFIKPPEHVYNSLDAAGIAGKLDMYDSIEGAIRSLL